MAGAAWSCGGAAVRAEGLLQEEVAVSGRMIFDETEHAVAEPFHRIRAPEDRTGAIASCRALHSQSLHLVSHARWSINDRSIRIAYSNTGFAINLPHQFGHILT